MFPESMNSFLNKRSCLNKDIVMPLSGRLEAADYGDEEEDPCMGTCDCDRRCVLAKNGAPLRVDQTEESREGC